MRHQRIRRSERGNVTPVLVLGLGLGLAAGFVLGEIYAGHGPTALRRALTPWRRPASGVRTVNQATEDLEQALGNVLGLDRESLELVRVGKNAIELHGWVSSRAARSRALRAARAALAPNVRLVDSLLVWGEDDLPGGDEPLAEESETA